MRENRFKAEKISGEGESLIGEVSVERWGEIE